MSREPRYIPARILSEPDQAVIGRWIDEARVKELIELLRLITVNPQVKFKHIEHAQITLKELQQKRSWKIALLSAVFAGLSFLCAVVSAWGAFSARQSTKAAKVAEPQHALPASESTAASLSRIKIEPLGFTINIPEGFVNVDNSYPQSVRDFFDALTPPTNRRLASFILKSVSEDARNGGTARFTRSLRCSVLREFENTDFSEKDFLELKAEAVAALPGEQAELRNNVSAPEKAINAELRKIYGRDFTIGIAKPTYLPVHDNSPNYFSYSLLVTITNNDGTSVMRCTTVLTGLLNRKVLYFSVSSDFSGSQDLRWTQVLAREWFKASK